VEILVVDNKGDNNLRDWIKYWLDGVRYERYTISCGTTQPRQHVFDAAKGDYVMCIDSHVLLGRNVVSDMIRWIDNNPKCDDLLHGPMMYDNGKTYVTRMDPAWRDSMFGTWEDPPRTELPDEPFEIPMMGLGLFCARRESWLGFNPAFRGFGGEEGYIHQKYRNHGRRVMCLPFLKWYHFFGLGTGYQVSLVDRVRNYMIGFWEVGLDTAPVIEHFGKRLAEQVIYG
jgi:glycosyltransferase involved in cell wall biosynthesis